MVGRTSPASRITSYNVCYTKLLRFPPCETILSFEKVEGKTTVSDPDLDRFPETVLIGVRPCDAAAPGVLDAVFSWDYDDPFYLERRKCTTIVGVACTEADDACFCTAVGLAPDSRVV